LARIQASVRLTAAEAPEVFAAACTRWLKNAMQATTGAAAPGAAASNGTALETGTQGADACKGREGSIRFSAHLGEEGGPAETPAVKTPRTEAQQSETSPTETTLSITLDGLASP
jgi:hypothetical protein